MTTKCWTRSRLNGTTYKICADAPPKMPVARKILVARISNHVKKPVTSFSKQKFTGSYDKPKRKDEPVKKKRAPRKRMKSRAPKVSKAAKNTVNTLVPGLYPTRKETKDWMDAHKLRWLQG